MIFTGGLSGGISSKISGGSFWAGVRQGLISSGLNHAMHDVSKPKNSNEYCPTCHATAIAISNATGITYVEAYYYVLKYGAEASIEFVKDVVGGANDFAVSYNEMKEANWVNSDKYFHAKANFLSSSRGEGGAWVAEKLSNFREITDQIIKGDTRLQSMQDQRANYFGRRMGTYSIFDRTQYRQALKYYIPNGLPKKY